jgi:hypothetical protein
MRGIVGLAVAALLAAAPSAKAGACARLPAGESQRVPVETVERGSLRTTLAVCDHGRRIVLRRARLVRSRRGSWIGGASAAGRRVAWIEERVVPGRRVAEVFVAEVRGRPRIVRRTIVLRDRGLGVTALDVLITRHGDLAWLVDTRVVLDRRGRRPARVLFRDAGGPLALEDGRTLRASTRYFDLRPFPGRGCPRRSHFQPVARTPFVEVTRAQYALPYDQAIAVLRACLRATGRDDAIVGGLEDEVHSVDLLGIDRDWVVIERSSFFRQLICGEERLSVIAAGSGRPGRDETLEVCAGDEPVQLFAGAPFAVSERGGLAWVARGTAGERLMALGVTGPLLELDRGPAWGAISGLHAQGRAVVWTNAGAARSADLG